MSGTGARVRVPAGGSVQEALRAIGREDRLDLLCAPVGEIVRTAAVRTTYAIRLADGTLGFAKCRTGRGGDARREWRRLEQLARDGFDVPARILLVTQGRRSMLVMRSVRGVPLSEHILDAAGNARSWPGLRAYLLGPVVAMLRRLHTAGYAHRDLYWNHLFAGATTDASPEPAIIDVERTIRPCRLRRRRWMVKELGSLLGSWPLDRVSRGDSLRFLRAWYGGRLPTGWKRFARAVVRRAARVRAHVPRHGSPPIWRRAPAEKSVRSP